MELKLSGNRGARVRHMSRVGKFSSLITVTTSHEDGGRTGLVWRDIGSRNILRGSGRQAASAKFRSFTAELAYHQYLKVAFAP